MIIGCAPNAFKVGKIRLAVLCFMALCSSVGGCQHSVGTCFLRLHGRNMPNGRMAGYDSVGQVDSLSWAQVVQCELFQDGMKKTKQTAGLSA
jgi:hypothetical protein